MKSKVAIIGIKGMPSRYSGLEVYSDIMAKALIDNDYEVGAFCRKEYCDEVVNEYNGIKIFHIPHIHTKHLDAITYACLATIIGIIKKYDCFWFQALGPSIMAFLPHFFKKKIVVTVHGLDWKREKFGLFAKKILMMGERNIARYADSIIVLNESDKAYFSNKYGRDTFLIKNGTVIIEKRSIGVICKKYDLSPNEYFLFMSRIVPEKKVDILIEAYKNVKTDKKLVIAGKGAYTNDYVKQVMNSAKNDSRIVFTGYISGDDINELYSNAYAYILPSSIEGQSIGLIEAMAAGLPCIVSDIEENKLTIKSCGYCFAEGDSNDLARVIEYILNNPDEAEMVGESAQLLARKEYDWKDKICKTLDVFETI